MKMNRLCLLLIPVLLLAGCWDIKDINKRFFPLIVAISKENDEAYTITLQMPIPQNVNEASRTVTVKADSIGKALEQVQLDAEDVIDYSQTQLIFIQSNLAKDQQAMQGLIHFAMNSKETPSRALLAITDENVEDLLKDINEKLGIQTTSIYDYFNKGYDWAPEIFSIPIWKAYQSLYFYTQDLAIPVARAGKDTVLTFEGSDVFRKGEKMDRISSAESLLLNMVQNKSEGGVVESLESADIHIINSSVKKNATMKNKRPVLSVDLHVTMRILEKKQDISDKNIQQQLQQRFEQRFHAMLQRLQEAHTDIFGFGQQFRQYISYDELKNWRTTYYPNLQVDFNVSTTITQ